MNGFDSIEICPRCHGGGREPALGLHDRVVDVLRPVPCYVCGGNGAVQRSLAAQRMDELVQPLRQFIKLVERYRILRRSAGGD